MTSIVLSQIVDELSTNLPPDRELHLIKSAHRIINNNFNVNVLIDRNDTYYRYVHRLMNITFISLEKNNADVRLAAEEYYEHILKEYECYGFPELSLKILAMSIEKLTGPRQVTKIIKYVVYYLDMLPKQRTPEKNGRTIHQDIVKTIILRSLDIDQTVCHQALEKSCDKLISSVTWQLTDLKEIADKTFQKLWSTKGHASRTMAELLGSIITESVESFRQMFNAHVDKIIEEFVSNIVLPVGCISLIRKSLSYYADGMPLDSLKGLTEMLILMIRDSSNEVAYDAFAALEELIRLQISKLDGFVPGKFLRSKFGSNTSDHEESNEVMEFVDPLVNADLYEQLQETKPPPKVDLVLEDFQKIGVDSLPSVENYVAAFLGKTFLLTGMGRLLKTDRQSKDSMKILAIRVLNVICVNSPLNNFYVLVAGKSQCLLDIVGYSSSPDDQLAQQAIKFMFQHLRQGVKIDDAFDVFKSVKKCRFLLNSVTVEHMDTLQSSQLFEYLKIMAFRSLLTTHYDFNLSEITSACSFMGTVRDWIVSKKVASGTYVGTVEQFQDTLKRCIMDCWDYPRFISAIPTLLSFHSSADGLEDQYPPSLPLRIDILPVVRSTKRASGLHSIIYDDWRTVLISEALMPTNVRMAAILRENVISLEYAYEKVPQLSTMHWSSDTLPAILQVMTVSLSEAPSREDCYHGFHVAMAVLNWIYRCVFIVRRAAETKEFPLLQHSRIEMDDALGKRAEFRSTLDAFYQTVQSSADEKVDQLLMPTVNLLTASMASSFTTTTENVLEIIVYIKVLFTLSPISALKLLHVLLRNLLNPKLVESLANGKVFHFQSSNANKCSNEDDFLIEALRCPDEKYFINWRDDMDMGNVKIGSMSATILEQLEPLITQSLKCFRNRGKNEKEQVLKIMFCLLNHKLKLLDADPSDCLMRYAVTTFAKPEECSHPELYDTLMHFLAIADRFQKENSYQKPITAATMLMKSIEKLPKESIAYAMKAVSFALMSGRYKPADVEELLRTSFSTWDLCITHAPAETIYALSLLLQKNDVGVKNQEHFWLVFSGWINESMNTRDHVPFSTIAFPISLIKDYLISDKVNIFEVIDIWIEDGAFGKLHAKSAVITALFFAAEKATSKEAWTRYFEFIFAIDNDSKAAQYIKKYADKSFLTLYFDNHDDVLDEELTADNLSPIDDLLKKHYCGSLQDLCHSIVCSGEADVLEFVDVIEEVYPDDDSIWGLLVAEFRRLEDDLEHRLDISFRIQDLAESLSKRFNANVYLKLLANIESSTLALNCLTITQVKALMDCVTPCCTEEGYILRGVCNLLSSSRMSQLISEDELGTATLYMALAGKVTGIVISEALLASYMEYRIDFQVKGEIPEDKVKGIKKFVSSLLALCQETNLRNPKSLTKSQSACFRHPVLNTIFNIPLIAIKCFNWVPVVEILRKPTITCLPPTGHVCDVMVLDDMRNRLSKVGLVTNAQFEVLFTTMQAVIAHTVIGPEKETHDGKDVLERESRSCKALELYIATILTSMKYPNGGDPSSGFVLKSPYLSELFLQSSEFAHLCNLKSVWKCEPRTAFTTPLERHSQQTWRHCDGRTNLYGICQTPLFALWQLCGMMPIEFKQHANYHRVDHSASNYFLTTATNIDTISNVKQLMNIFEYWYSQGIGELSEMLLHAILHTILHLSDFFDDPELHKAVLRTTSIIYKHEYDQNPFLTSFVHVMFLKSISVLGADMNGSEFKPGELETITQKIVLSGLSDAIKIVRFHTLAGLLYLVQSDSYESFMPSIDILSAYLESFLRKLANGLGRVESDECQVVFALIIKLLEVPIRLKQDKKHLLKLFLASMRVRRERFIIELVAEGVEQLLCRSNEFNGEVIDFLLAGLESGDPIPFPTDNEHYCRVVYRILMVAATRAKVANDVKSMTRIHDALQKIGFDILLHGETSSSIARTLPFFSICVHGVEGTINRYRESFSEKDNENNRILTALLNQTVETATTSKKWSAELKTFHDTLQSNANAFDSQSQWLIQLLNSKNLD